MTKCFVRSFMKRFFTPSNVVTAVIIATVVAMVGYANWRDVKKSRVVDVTARPVGVPGAPSTSRADLEGRVKDMRARVAAHPNDVRAAVLLAEGLVRQTRVTGSAGLAVEAEQV